MDENSADYDNPDVEEAWCEARREEITEYLKKQQLDHGRIGEWPTWHVPPVVSVWAIESRTTPGAVGWWAICGDLPTDYLSAHDARDPREAVRAFAARWRTMAEAMREGRDSPNTSIGSTPEERRSLAPLLASRAQLLAEWGDRDDVWEDLFDED